mmetsp:Transcript_116036/g.248084  ORF Transcript_116036/g.248084 Transcript_116036/m.248084 type:complete len:319 (-) Transcript_116036:170-1126(-)
MRRAAGTIVTPMPWLARPLLSALSVPTPSASSSAASSETAGRARLAFLCCCLRRSPSSLACARCISATRRLTSRRWCAFKLSTSLALRISSSKDEPRRIAAPSALALALSISRRVCCDMGGCSERGEPGSTGDVDWLRLPPFLQCRRRCDRPRLRPRGERRGPRPRGGGPAGGTGPPSPGVASPHTGIPEPSSQEEESWLATAVSRIAPRALGPPRGLPRGLFETFLALPGLLRELPTSCGSLGKAEAGSRSTSPGCGRTFASLKMDGKAAMPPSSSPTTGRVGPELERGEMTASMKRSLVPPPERGAIAKRPIALHR